MRKCNVVKIEKTTTKKKYCHARSNNKIFYYTTTVTLYILLFFSLFYQASPWQEWTWGHVRYYNETLRRVINEALSNNVTLNDTLGDGNISLAPIATFGTYRAVDLQT